jgi:Uncharacterized protein with conserved CXXC pairs
MQTRRGDVTNEFINPKRMLTSSIKAECMKIFRETTAKPPYQVGKIVIENILDTGANIIMTNN